MLGISEHDTPFTTLALLGGVGTPAALTAGRRQFLCPYTQLPQSGGTKTTPGRGPDTPLCLQEDEIQLQRATDHTANLIAMPLVAGTCTGSQAHQAQGRGSTGFPEPDQRSWWLCRLHSPPKPNGDFSHTVQWKRRSSPLNVLGFTSTRHQQKAGLEMLLLQGEITSHPQHLGDLGGQIQGDGC